MMVGPLVRHQATAPQYTGLAFFLTPVFITQGSVAPFALLFALMVVLPPCPPALSAQVLFVAIFIPYGCLVVGVGQQATLPQYTSEWQAVYTSALLLALMTVPPTPNPRTAPALSAQVLFGAIIIPYGCLVVGVVQQATIPQYSSERQAVYASALLLALMTVYTASTVVCLWVFHCVQAQESEASRLIEVEWQPHDMMFFLVSEGVGVVVQTTRGGVHSEHCGVFVGVPLRASTRE